MIVEAVTAIAFECVPHAGSPGNIEPVVVQSVLDVDWMRGCELSASMPQHFDLWEAARLQFRSVNWILSRRVRNGYSFRRVGAVFIGICFQRCPVHSAIEESDVCNYHNSIFVLVQRKRIP